MASYKSNRHMSCTKVFVLGKKKTRYYLGDRNSYHSEYLKSEHWRKLRNEKLKLDASCENCGRINNLDVHHINYKNLYDVTIFDLKTLCRTCHHRIHAVNTNDRTKTLNRRRLRRFIRRTSKLGKISPAIVSKFIKLNK